MGNRNPKPKKDADSTNADVHQRPSAPIAVTGAESLNAADERAEPNRNKWVTDFDVDDEGLTVQESIKQEEVMLYL